MTQTTIIAGGVLVPSLAIAQADQLSILGDGTSERPLRAGSATQDPTFPATPVPAVTAHLGQGVAVTPGVPGFGIARVTQDPTKGQVGALVIIGLPVFVQSSGILTLTTAQWDVVTGASGGLTRGSVYYLSLVTNGRITATRPSTTGQLVSRVGVALSPTAMLLTLPTVPVANP